MKRQRHKHKESFSILLISNTGQSSRQFHVSLFLYRLFVILLLLICAALGGLTFLFTREYGKRTDLVQQVVSQSQLIAQLESEKNTLNSENLALTAENDGLRQAAIVNAEEKAAELKKYSELGVTRFFRQSQERIEEEEAILKKLEEIDGGSLK